jgi:hypothetical protein
MTRAEAEALLGAPDEVVDAGDEAGLRYGRTHVWVKGVPFRGSVVTDVTTGPR